MNSAGVLESLRVGKPKRFSDKRGDWESALIKHASSSHLWAGEAGLAGDGQADRKHHGGAEKAICVYPLAHYCYWNARLGVEWSAGAFGENITIKGVSEGEVAIGDVYRVGEAIVQVTQPRSPCWKIARFHGLKKLALYLQQTGYTGWYLRVLKEGYVGQGDVFSLRERAPDPVTVQEANVLAYEGGDPSTLLRCSGLSASWRKKFEARTSPDARLRLYGSHNS